MTSTVETAHSVLRNNSESSFLVPFLDDNSG